ncbi:MAG: hypothetical protein U5O39_10985 [Gammaproteobacteria bacterium]|nr:hypothetical protein [Gammaproteobacteria bacterium]
MIRAEITRRFDYDLGRSVDDIRPGYRFDVSCQDSVPESTIAFLDADTQACIAGAIAEAWYGGVPDDIMMATRERLDTPLLEILDRFTARFLQ